MRIVLFGPPGVGKGTQGGRIAEDLGIVHVVCGDILRSAAKGETSLALEAKRYMDSGQLVPDAVVIGLIEERMNEAPAGFLLDGFPRNVAQARALDGMLAGHGWHLDRVVFLQAREGILMERLAGRWLCRTCGFGYHQRFTPPRVAGHCDRCGGELYQRDDDREDVIAARLKVYKQQTEPLLEYYAGHPGFREVNGEGDVEVVRRDLNKALLG